MNFDHRNPRLRRGFAFVALAAVLGLSAVGLTQCRLVNDTVTGVDLDSNSSTFKSRHSRRSRCVHQCNEKYKRCLKQEEAVHKRNMKACRKDAACRKAEQKRHYNAVKACIRQMQLCKKGCRYREGAGSAGR
jgi:hypothetical protein